jgi:cysteine desulfurase
MKVIFMMSEKRIYFDNNATTPVDPRVLEAMLPYFTEKFGNAASNTHIFGWDAAEAVDSARDQVASIIGAQANDIVFTSGATESDNIALKGTLEKYSDKGNHLITVKTEHKAVLDSAKYLLEKGYKVTFMDVGEDGRVIPEQLEEAITPETVLISVMFANNETGVIHPIEEIGKIAAKHDVFFHCDATQAIGKVPVDVEKLGIHLLSMSGHKLYGPKGIGVLYARSRNPKVRPNPVIHGGGHEQKMRSGSLNVPGIVGIGTACEICVREMPAESVKLANLRDRLENGILERIEEVYVNGSREHRIPNTSNISFNYIEGESIMLTMKNIAVSSGSACTSASLSKSYVLDAMGCTDALAHASLRFSLGRFNTEEEVDLVIESLVKAVKRLREMSPLYEMAQKGIDLESVKWTEPKHEH